MSTITSLKLGSVPITEEGVERYKFSDPITNHFTQIAEFTENLNSSVGRVFSKTKIPVSWVTVMNANYLIATMEFNNPSGSSLNIKAWIDSIDILSDSEDYPQVEVRWHFDYYEMFKSSATLGYGHVKRRPFDDLDSTPIQNYNYNYLKVDTAGEVDLLPRYEFTNSNYGKSELWWVYFSFNYKDANGKTLIGIYGFPAPICQTLQAKGERYTYRADVQLNGGTKYACLSLGQVMSGYLDEWYGIMPETVNGVWLSPYMFDVSELSGTGTLADPINITNANAYLSVINVGGGTGSGIGFVANNRGTPVKKTVTISADPICSTETERYILVDLDGSKILELPYGYKFTSVDIYPIFEADSAAMIFSFKNELDGRSEGMVGVAPLPVLPVNTNALSEYVYSGQREYDREARTIASNANAWKSSASGAGQGAMMGAFGAPGLLLGAGGGMAGGLISYGVEMLYQNDEEQRILDRLKANQPSSLIMGSNARALIANLKGYRLIKLKMDDYSAGLVTSNRANFGISVDEILSSCETLVKTTLPTGYYSIKNLIISGSIPKEAKDYIKRKFDAGVRLL